jgi:hypothetical protein
MDMTRAARVGNGSERAIGAWRSLEWSCMKGSTTCIGVCGVPSRCPTAYVQNLKYDDEFPIPSTLSFAIPCR